jgi:tryptophan synthase alpha chain
MSEPRPAGGASGASAIETAIAGARHAGRPALAPFLTAGFPRREGFSELLDAVAAEAEVVEIGVPFSDPMADGVTIQRASRVALQAGVNLRWILEVIAARRRPTPVVLMSYLNPLLAFGLTRLAGVAAAAGMAGLIVPDLPYEESREFSAALENGGVALIQLTTPVTGPERLASICRASRGFVYAVMVTGTTGGTSDLSDAGRAYLDRVRAVSSLPVLAGFGIRTAGQLQAVAPHADGAIVGSALIEVLERGEDPVAFLRGLRAAPAPAPAEPGS